MQFDLSNGLSAAGTALAGYAGATGLQAQKDAAEQDKIRLADELAGVREEKGRTFTTSERVAGQTFTGGQNDLTRQNQLETTKMHVDATKYSADSSAGASRYATDQRTAVEREALTPAEVRTAQWFSKASPEERKAFQTQLLIKSGMPVWAAGGSAADTPVPGATATTPVRGSEGSMDDTSGTPVVGAKPEKKADAGGVTGTLPSPNIDDDKLKQTPPEARATIKAMLEGRMPAPTSFAMSKPYWQTMMGLANAVDPTFDQTSWQSRVATRRDFTAGKAAATVTALNTALGHAGVVSDALEKVDNGTIPMWNAIVNKLGTELGGNKVTTATQAVDALASEARKVFAASGGGNLTELQEWQKNFPINGSKEQQQGAMKLFVNLLDSRLGALSDQYNRGMGTTSDPLQFLEPKARQVFQQLSGNAPDNSTGYQFGKPPPSISPASGPAALPPVEQRAIGRTYQTPTGPHIWMGNGWAPVPPQDNP